MNSFPSFSFSFVGSLAHPLQKLILINLLFHGFWVVNSWNYRQTHCYEEIFLCFILVFNFFGVFFLKKFKPTQNRDIAKTILLYSHYIQQGFANLFYYIFSIYKVICGYRSKPNISSHFNLIYFNMHLKNIVNVFLHNHYAIITHNKINKLFGII